MRTFLSNLFRKPAAAPRPTATSEATRFRMEHNAAALAAAILQRDTAAEKLQATWNERAEIGLPIDGDTASRAAEDNLATAQAAVETATLYASRATVPRDENGLPEMFRFTPAA